ncbi:MAG: helix-turn-helix transcriptional regulator [Planctomycetota bacterium]
MSRLNYARIVYRLLHDPRGWRVDELQRELGIAPRTWTKYRAVLEQEFEPFFDRRGGTRLQVVEEGGERWLRLVDPAPREAAANLVARLAAGRLAGLLVGALGDDFRQAIGEAFAALGRRRSPEELRLLRRIERDLDRLLYVRPHAAKDYRHKGEVVGLLLEALVQHRRVALDYEAASAPGSRVHELEPLTLALYQGGLHLLARYVGRRRVYNFVVDRIAGLELGAETFAYPAAADYDPERVLAASFGIFFAARGGRPQRVRLRFAAKPWLQAYLLERRWHPTQRFRRRRDGRLELSIEVANLVEVAQWVRGFGEDVEVLAPRALREG